MGATDSASDEVAVQQRQGSSPHSQPEPVRRNRIGTVSLLIATAGAVLTRFLQHHGPFVTASWLPYAVAGFDAAMVGGLADWFAVTALFRHPLGLPIPHTAIIPKRRARIIEGIVSMVQDEWLSPAVLSARLQRVAPSELLLDWLESAGHVSRISAPVRDLLRSLARLLEEPTVVGFVERTLRRELQAVPLDRSAGRWLLRVIDNDATGAAFESAARSVANLARQPETARAIKVWMKRAALQLHAEGKRLVPLLLRRKMVQHKLVEAICDYVAAEAAAAAVDPNHRLREAILGVLRRVAQRIADGDEQTLQQMENLRQALLESLDTQPIVRDLFGRLRQQLDGELAQPDSALTEWIDEQLRHGIVELLDSPDRRATFDDWVRNTATDLLQRHHHLIGLTVRENLEALETDALVAQIEARVGNDLQFIRLNGALVGGLIGVLLALIHHLF